MRLLRVEFGDEFVTILHFNWHIPIKLDAILAAIGVHGVHFFTGEYSSAIQEEEIVERNFFLLECSVKTDVRCARDGLIIYKAWPCGDNNQVLTEVFSLELREVPLVQGESGQVLLDRPVGAVFEIADPQHLDAAIDLGSCDAQQCFMKIHFLCLSIN